MGKFLLTLIILITNLNFAYATTVTVLTVYDGDTFVVDRQGDEVKIKLYGIDSPEAGQNGNGLSTRFLKHLILNSLLEIKVIDTDIFGRTLAVAIREGRESSVNAAIVSNGYAWVNPKKCKIEECKKWDELESKARMLKLGIWSGFDLVPPWEFRKMQAK